jgi:hypothetical protein
MDLSVNLSIPQAEFVSAPDRFPAFVAGFGCVHPDTKIHTEFGLMRIADINKPMYVLSIDPKGNLVYSFTGGSFAKGKEKLTTVIGQDGSFKASSQHAVLTVNAGFRKVSELDSEMVFQMHDIQEWMAEMSWVDYRDVREMTLYAERAREFGKRFIGDPLLEPYYDMQVLETNNYVCEHGFVHHNSGKTNAGIWRLLRLKFQYPKQNVAWYLPTYDLISKIAYPRFAEILGENGVEYQLNKQDNILHLNGGQVIFRTLDAPERIVGYEVADSVVDELDTLPMEKAKNAWRAIIARNRQKKPDGEVNTVGVTTTPEGFKFVYDRWERNPAEGYRIIRASTLSNAHNLPADYIQTLQESYPANLLEAYLNGHFVNMTQGSVYPDFNRYDNYCDTEIKPFEPLHFGMDFNVGNTSASGFVYRNQDPHAVIEFTKVLDTPSMITILTRLKNEGHPIYIYPDASGNWRKSNNASQSDLSLLRNAGFTVLVNARNPQIRDRVLAVNNLIHNNGKRRLKVNTDRCPALTESLERQAYDTNGDPDKKSGLDHVIDGAGYFLSYKHPIQGVAVQRMKLMGL